MIICSVINKLIKSVRGVRLDDNLAGKTFLTCFKEDIVIPLTFVSDKIIFFFTIQSVILQCLY